MGAVINKMQKQENPKYPTFSNVYRFKKRVYEVRAPCQWLTHCHDGKCPSFVRINGNYYCVKQGIS